MFLPHLSLSRILPAVMLSCGISYLLTYNKSLDASGRATLGLFAAFWDGDFELSTLLHFLPLVFDRKSLGGAYEVRIARYDAMRLA
jgi:hypothetical protein